MEASFPSVDHPVLFRTSFCFETFFFFFLRLIIRRLKPFFSLPPFDSIAGFAESATVVSTYCEFKIRFLCLTHPHRHVPHAPPPPSLWRVQHELYFPYFIILPSLLCLFYMWCPGRRQTSSSSSTRYASELQEHGRKPIPDTAADDDYCSAADRARFLQNPAILDTLDSVHRSLLFNNLKFDTGKWWSW